MSGSDVPLAPVALDATDGALTIDGRITYEWAARKRPFIHPLRTPSGQVLTCNAPDDHPWHHGLWFTIKFLNGENFWEEYDAYGVLRHTGPPIPMASAPGTCVIAGELEWIRPDRKTVVLSEMRRLHYQRLSDDAYSLCFSTTLSPTVDVEFDRTPFTTWGGYGGLAFRGRPDWHDTRLLLDDGGPRERVLGDRSRWLALDGLVGPGDAPAGIVLVSSNGNPGHPESWYASTRADTYGDEGWSNFVNAAFLWDGPIRVGAHDAFRLEYHVIVHDHHWDTEQIEAAILALQPVELVDRMPLDGANVHGVGPEL